MLLHRASSSEAPTRQPHHGQTLTLARCLRVGLDEFGALDKIAAVQLDGAPTFGLLDQPLEQAFSLGSAGSPPVVARDHRPLVSRVYGVIRSPWWRFPRYTWAKGSTLMTLAVQGASVWSRISSSYRPTLIKTRTSGQKAHTPAESWARRPWMPGRSTYAPALPGRHCAATNEGDGGRSRSAVGDCRFGAKASTL